jgi:hypothetical protein
MFKGARSRASSRKSALGPILVLAILLTSFSAAFIAGASGQDGSLGSVLATARKGLGICAGPQDFRKRPSE